VPSQRDKKLLPDIVDKTTRSRMMSGIRGKNTKPELLIRQGLFARGFRYRLHSSAVRGKPDIVLRKYCAVIFVHGCFWHGHHCHLFKLPSSRTPFWLEKISRNRARDQMVRGQLRASGWRQLVIWECALRGKTRLDLDVAMARVEAWLRGDVPESEIAGAV
jgi:DNA mismatch endonuclease (patch repair protein)